MKRIDVISPGMRKLVPVRESSPYLDVEAKRAAALAWVCAMNPRAVAESTTEQAYAAGFLAGWGDCLNALESVGLIKRETLTEDDKRARMLA